MTAATTALVPLQPAFGDAERLALAGFPAGYRGLTRAAYALALRQFTSWCRARCLSLCAVRRAGIESFARDLETRGRAQATVTRRPCTIAGFCKHAVEEDLLEHSPGRARPPPAGGLPGARRRPGPQRARRPAGRRRARPAGRARADLPARAERAAGPGGHRHRHRAAGPAARAPDADHHPHGRQGDRHPAGAAHRPGDRPGRRRAHRRAGVPGRGRAAAGPARRRGGSSARPRAAPGSPRPSRPTRCGTRSSPPRSTPGCRCATCKRPRRTLIREPRCGMTGHAAAWTGTPRISSPRISQVPPGRPRISQVPPGSPCRLAAPPGGDGGQAEVPPSDSGSRGRCPRSGHGP